MSIEVVFRIRCDECRKWISLPEGYVPGTDIEHVDLVVADTAEHAGLWPSRAAAVNAAFGADCVIEGNLNNDITIVRCKECR